MAQKLNQETTSTVNVNGEQAKKELLEVEKRAESLRDKYVKLNAEAKEYAIDDPKRYAIEKEMAKVDKQYKSTQKEVKQLKKETFDLTKVLDDLSGSSLKDLIKAQKALENQLKNGSIKRNTEEWKIANDQLKLVKTEISGIKEQSKICESGISSFSDKLSNIPGPAGQAIQAVKGFGSALKLLLLNPVGLIIAAVVAGLMLLYKAFMATDSGANMFAGVLKGLGNVMDIILDRTMSFLNLLKSIATFDMEGIKKNAQDTFGGIAASIKEAAIAGYNYVQIMDSISDRESASLIRASKLRAEIEKLKNAAKDQNKPIEERIRLNDLAMQKEKELLGIEKGFMKEKLDAEISNLASKLQVQGLSVKQKEQQIREWLKLDDKQIEQYAKNNARFANFIDKNEEEFQKLQKQKSEEYDKDAEFEQNTRRLQKESFSFKSELLKEETNKQKELAAKKKKLSEEEIEQKKKLKSENDKLAKEMSDAAIADLQQTLETSRLVSREQLAGVKQTLEQEHELKLKQLQEDKQLEINKAELSTKSVEDIAQEKRLIEQKYRTLTAEENAAFKTNQANLDKEKELKLLSDKLAITAQGTQEAFDIEKQMRELAMAEELKIVEDGSAEAKAIRDKYREMDETAEAELLQKKQDMVFKYAEAGMNVFSDLNNFIGALGDRELAEFKKNNEGKANFDEEYAKKKAELDRKNAVRQKALSAMGIILTTTQAVMAALATMPATPLNPVLAIAAAASGAIQLATVLATPLPEGFAEGGFTDPGDKYEPRGIVHAGEFVANQDAVGNNTLRRLFNVVDYAQKTNTVGRIDNDAIARALSIGQGYAGGGFVLPAGNGGTPDSSTMNIAAMMAVMQQTNAVNAALLAEVKRGIKAKTYVSGAGGINEATDMYNTLIKNAGR